MADVVGISSGERFGTSTSAAIGTIVASNNFTTGTGNVTVGNSGVNGTAFTSVVATPAGNTFTYDGTGQGLVTLGVTAGEAYAVWDSTVLGTQAQRYGRLDATFSSVAPAGSIRLFRFLGSGASRAAVQLTTTGRLQIINSAGSTLATGIVAVPTAQKLRVEFRVVGDAAVGEVELRWWSDSTSTGPPTEVLQAVNVNTGGTIDAIRAGHSGTVQANFTYTIDNISVSNNGWTADPTIFLAPSAIRTAQLLGDTKTALAVAPTIEISAVRWLSTATVQTISPIGIPSASQAGAISVALAIVATGIRSGEQLGSVTTTAGAVIVSPAGIVSGQAFGAVIAANAAPQSLSFVGITSEQRLGLAQVAQLVSVAGVISSERLGNAVATPGTASITGAGIPSRQVFGVLILNREGIPDAILISTNLTGSLVDIQDDPMSPDANYLTAIDPTLATDLRVSFPTPFLQPSAVGGPKTFRVYVRRTATPGAPDPTVVLDLWESGVFKSQLASLTVTSTSGQLVQGTINPADLTDPSGAGVELRVRGVPV